MRRVRNIAGLAAASVRGLEAYLAAEPATAWVTNVRKAQYVNLSTVEGREMVVKSYFHKTWKHRFVSFLGLANADRYVRACRVLAATGVAVPAPALVMKLGPGILPHATLLVMERLPGEMLVTHLKAIEADPARLADIAAKVAGILRGLHRAKVAHRDLNAKNILVTPDNRVSLIDFDFATCYPFRGRSFRRRHARDLGTFFNHCGADSVFAREVRRFLENGLQVGNHEIHERH